jgi:PA-IL-like protein
MKSRRTSLSVLLLGVVLLATTGLVAMSGVAQASTTTVQVGGTPTWTDTGFAVTAGETLSMTASGTVFFRRFDRLGADPDGGSCAVPHSEFTAPDLTCYSLIGRVGTGGTPFEVGESYSQPFPISGELFLLANDNNGAFGNNSSMWTVVINDTVVLVTTTIAPTTTTSPPTTVAPVVTKAVTSPSTSLAFTGLGLGFQIMALVGFVLLLIGALLYFEPDALRNVSRWFLRGW